MEHFAASRLLQRDAKLILAHAEVAGWCCYPTKEDEIEQRKNNRLAYHREYERKKRAEWVAQGLTTEGTPRKRRPNRHYSNDDERRTANRDRMRLIRAAKRNILPSPSQPKVKLD